MLKIGCCGFPCAKEKYYKTFSVVELQNTFYTIPKLTLLEKYRASAPVNFEFTIKAPQFITHPATSPTYRRANIELKNPEQYGYFKPTKEVRKIWEIVLEEAETLKAQVIVFQSPASFQPTATNIKNLNLFFNQIERKDLKLIWEPRGKWEPKLIAELCSDLNLIDCVDPFLRAPTYGKFLYLRLHGGKGYRKKYSDEELKKLIELTKGKDGYIMFNNIHMFDDAQKLNDFIGKR
jgi:uncharacterized protein YecE (DUF72 family)